MTDEARIAELRNEVIDAAIRDVSTMIERAKRIQFDEGEQAAISGPYKFTETKAALDALCAALREPTQAIFVEKGNEHPEEYSGVCPHGRPIGNCGDCIRAVPAPTEDIAGENARLLVMLGECSQRHHEPEAAFSHRDLIWLRVQGERMRQDRKWGGAEHDAGHSALDWAAILVRLTTEAAEDTNGYQGERAVEKIIATALAWREALARYDRERGAG